MPASHADHGGSLAPEQWVDEHGDTLFRYALSRLRDPEAAEEVVQETFVAGLRASDQYAGQGSEGAWLMGICKRKVIDCVRGRNRLDAAAGGEASSDPSAALFDAKGNWRVAPRVAKGRPEAAMERADFWKAFRGCLKQLPQRQADAFTLQEVEDMAGDDICKELGISSSNLWVLLHRARLRLTQCMKWHLEKWGLSDHASLPRGCSTGVGIDGP